MRTLQNAVQFFSNVESKDKSDFCEGCCVADPNARTLVSHLECDARSDEVKPARNQRLGLYRLLRAA